MSKTSTKSTHPSCQTHAGNHFKSAALNCCEQTTGFFSWDTSRRVRSHQQEASRCSNNCDWSTGFCHSQRRPVNHLPIFAFSFQTPSLGVFFFFWGAFLFNSLRPTDLGNNASGRISRSSFTEATLSTAAICSEDKDPSANVTTTALHEYV